MSVRATGSLIGEIVTASGLSNSPKMVVQSVDVDAKLVTTVWFSNAQEGQQGVFPASALDKADVVAAKKPTADSRKGPAKKK
ncbi:hypothetical protein TREPR_3364 [Treponema primitia ZAS-2]|uniref:Uncharacterized protein n=1 Tax=Treponema primitia (strain ATCC BAA-887 / DSM 12427 / ZAS-2) TaxID=545694 RepID=F5YK53_TREPZ|nr:hypothetical protein [Treponema primitia]AEF85459.1 hypothetical protein TREPR_3364 [Treponema primitia ZAS-2]